MTTALTKPRRQRLPGTTIGPLGPSIHILFQEHDDAGAVVTEFYCCLTVTRDCNGETKLSFADDHIGPDNERCARTITLLGSIVFAIGVSHRGTSPSSPTR